MKLQIREREGNEKKPFPLFGNRQGMKKLFPKSGNGKGMKKSLPKIQEREGNEQNPSHNSGMGIRGYHSWECTGTGIPAHPYSLFSTERGKNLHMVLTLGQGTLRSPD